MRKELGRGEGGRRKQGRYRHAVIQRPEEKCDAAGGVGQGEDGPAVDGGCGVDGGDEVAEDGRVADEEAPVHDEVIGAGEHGDVAVDKRKVVVHHEQRGNFTGVKWPPFSTSPSFARLPMAELAAAPRLVPGAPQPIAQSRSQRKKRKTGAKSKTPGSPAEGSVTIPDAPAVLVVTAPNNTDPKEDNLATEPVPPSEAATHDDLNPKSSPVIELVQKRMRALNKKIVCLSVLLSPLLAALTRRPHNSLGSQAMPRWTTKNSMTTKSGHSKPFPLSTPSTKSSGTSRSQ